MPTQLPDNLGRWLGEPVADAPSDAGEVRGVGVQWGWGPDGVRVSRGDSHLDLGDGGQVTIKLARSVEPARRTFWQWLAVLPPAEAHVLHVELVGEGGQSVPLAATAPASLLEGLPWMRRPGHRLEVASLVRGLAALRGFGARVASWPADAQERPASSRIEPRTLTLRDTRSRALIRTLTVIFTAPYVALALLVLPALGSSRVVGLDDNRAAWAAFVALTWLLPVYVRWMFRRGTIVLGEDGLVARRGLLARRIPWDHVLRIAVWPIRQQAGLFRVQLVAPSQLDAELKVRGDQAERAEAALRHLDGASATSPRFDDQLAACLNAIGSAPPTFFPRLMRVLPLVALALALWGSHQAAVEHGDIASSLVAASEAIAEGDAAAAHQALDRVASYVGGSQALARCEADALRLEALLVANDLRAARAHCYDLLADGDRCFGLLYRAAGSTQLEPLCRQLGRAVQALDLLERGNYAEAARRLETFTFEPWRTYLAPLEGRIAAGMAAPGGEPPLAERVDGPAPR